MEELEKAIEKDKKLKQVLSAELLTLEKGLKEKEENLKRTIRQINKEINPFRDKVVTKKRELSKIEPLFEREQRLKIYKIAKYFGINPQ